MALEDDVLENKLKTVFGSIIKRGLLRKRLEGGNPLNIRRDEFSPTDTKVEYEADQLITPMGGIYSALKSVDDYVLANRPAPGEDMNKVKKEMWREFSRQMSAEISKNIIDWLEKDVVADLAHEINEQIKKADITITVHPGATLDQVVAGTTITYVAAAYKSGTDIQPSAVKIE
jgi:hypothetical protein